MAKSSVCAGFLAVGIVLLSGQAYALQAVLTAEDAAVITDPEDQLEQRVLARYEVPDLLRTARIFYAQLSGKVVVEPAADGGVVEMEAIPVTTEWNGDAVSWSTPWSEPGGDVALDARGCFLVPGGSQPIRMNVTDLVTQWAHGERSNLGLMIRTSSSQEGSSRLPSSSGAGDAALEIPVIRVWYLPAAE